MQNSEERYLGPLTPEFSEAYYKLRYEVLRKPWNQPLGSERDSGDEQAIHGILVIKKQLLAIGRLHFKDQNISQIRYMAVHPSFSGNKFGKKVLEYLEGQSISDNRMLVYLHARENALGFYEKCGYTQMEESELLWGVIRHWRMEKKL